ncbi:UNVERIFIED_CONTAM: hypothetical protein RMT77_008565 [Armadillidium vulgare]
MYCGRFSRSFLRPISFTLKNFLFSKPYSEPIKNFSRLNIFQHITPQKIHKRFYSEAKKVTLNSSSKGLGQKYRSVNQDVCIYVNENSKFFKYLRLFSVSQFIFWSYLSHTSYTTMKNIPVTVEEFEEVKKLQEQGEWKFISIWRRMNLGQYKNVISGFSAVVGFLALCLASLYTTRSIKTIILKKGGENVMIQFYSLFGNGKQNIIPISNISAKSGRHSAESYIILKVKDWKLHVIADAKGTFPNTELFDYTVGTQRSWKK